MHIFRRSNKYFLHIFGQLKFQEIHILDRNIFKNLGNLGKKVRLWRFSAESFACSGTFFDGSYIFMSELLLKHHTFMREV